MGIYSLAMWGFSILCVGVVTGGVVHQCTLKTFGDEIEMSKFINSTSEASSLGSSVFRLDEWIDERKNNTEISSQYLNSLEINLTDSNNDSESRFQILKNWCLSRYLDTYKSAFISARTNELNEIKAICSINSST